MPSKLQCIILHIQNEQVFSTFKTSSYNIMYVLKEELKLIEQ